MLSSVDLSIILTEKIFARLFVLNAILEYINTKRSVIFIIFSVVFFSFTHFVSGFVAVFYFSVSDQSFMQSELSQFHPLQIPIPLTITL